MDRSLTNGPEGKTSSVLHQRSSAGHSSSRSPMVYWMLTHHQSSVISYKLPFLLKSTSLTYLQLSPLVLSSFNSHGQPCKPHTDRWQLGQAVSRTPTLESGQLPEQPRSKNHFILRKRNKWERSIKGTSTAKVMQSRGEGDLMCLRCLMG